MSKSRPKLPPARQPKEPLVGEEDGQADQGLESFDQVVAADVVLQVTAQESRVRPEAGDKIRFDIAAGHELAVQAAP